MVASLQSGFQQAFIPKALQVGRSIAKHHTVRLSSTAQTKPQMAFPCETVLSTARTKGDVIDIVVPGQSGLITAPINITFSRRRRYTFPVQAIYVPPPGILSKTEQAK